MKVEFSEWYVLAAALLLALFAFYIAFDAYSVYERAFDVYEGSRLVACQVKFLNMTGVLG